jgi:glutathione S-transferase
VLLYNSRISGNCYKVRLLLAHLGIAYETQEVEVVDRSAPRDFLDDLNPAKRVPTLVLDDGRPLAESNAILCYFAEGTEYLPDDRFDRAQVLQWLFFEQYEHEPGVAVARFLLTYSGRAGEFADLIAERQRQGKRALASMEHWLTSHEWLAAERYTIADIALYAYTHAADEAGIALADYPAIQTWLGRVAAQPGHVPIDA